MLRAAALSSVLRARTAADADVGRPAWDALPKKEQKKVLDAGIRRLGLHGLSQREQKRVIALARSLVVATDTISQAAHPGSRDAAADRTTLAGAADSDVGVDRPTLPADEESFGVSGDDRPGERADDEPLDEPSEPVDGFVMVSDWWGHDHELLEFLEDIHPWLGDIAVPEDELLDVLGSDAVVLVVDPAGAVGGVARAALVVGDDGSTTGRVESMLVAPRYRGGVVERELSRAMEGRLAELGADRIEWPVVRPRGSEPATTVFHQPQYAGLVGSAVPSSPSRVRSAGSQSKSLWTTAGDIASAASQQVGG
ncbi:MAG: hypothetical protein ACRCZP_16575, partial [Phycicoccus sp.]